MLISIIIPCFQNEVQLTGTVERIIKAIGPLQDNFELILVDDGSTDGTWRIISNLSSRFEIIGGIKLAQNIGAYNALIAGFDNAKGDALLVMAADGDDPPELVPELLANLKDADAVLANRAESEKSWSNSFISKLFYAVLRLFGAKHIPKGGSDFLLMKREILKRCQKEGFKSGNTLVQLVQHANSVNIIPYKKGSSKSTSWTLKRKILLLLQTLNQFTNVPFVSKRPTPYSIDETIGLLRSFDK